MPDLLRSQRLDTIERSLVVGLAQLVERQIVVLEVVGSNPTSHPTLPYGSRELASRYTESMTIDERLEKLTERHEALTMNLELLHRDVQDLKAVAQQDGENIRALMLHAQQDGESIRALARIA